MEPQIRFHHVPVLLRETIDLLGCRPGGTYVDCTVGGGGHAAAILEQIGEAGRLIGLDRDADAIVAARERLAPFGRQVTLVHRDFRELPAVLDELGIDAVDGILYDLGVSSHQLDAAERGFSYERDAPLDMRMDRRQSLTARDLVNTLPASELAALIRRYGEERWARRIAAFIAEHRARKPIETTRELAEIVKAAIPAAARREGPHPARRTFQALRIAVNDELCGLGEALAAAVERLRPGGRICVISFHSLEDREVKRAFADLARGCRCPPDFPVCRCGGTPKLRIVTRKPVVPGEDELAANPRARSAKLRAAERLGPSAAAGSRVLRDGKGE